MEENKVEMMQEMEIPTSYTLRPLRDDDLFPMLDIIGRVIPEEMAPAFAGVVTGEKSLEEIGIKIGFRLAKEVIKNLPTVGGDVYAFLSDLSGIPADMIPKMKFGTTPKMIWDVYNEVKNEDFFGVFSKSP